MIFRILHLAPRRALGAAAILPALVIGALRGGAGEPRPEGSLPQGARLAEALFAGVDPRRDPLEIEMVKEWDETEGDVHIEQLYFTGQILDGSRTRVYAIRGAPRSGDRLPGILHCHGGGQTAYLEWVRFWARRGYACVSFDYSGDTNKLGLPQYRREHFTRWGEAVEKAMAEWGKEPPERRSPMGSNWYHFALAGRRAITLLEGHPRVDRERIGAFGVSAGGYLSWILAGTDRRLRTIVPIYGHGAGIFRDQNGRLLEPDGPDFEAKKFQVSPDAPELYAPLIHCPVFFLTATNDGFNLDYAPDTLGRLGSAVLRMLYTPRYSHHIRPAEGRSLPLWMAWQLKGEGGPWPGTPALKFEVAEGEPQIRVEPGAPQLVDGMEIYYALDSPRAMSRFWRDAERVRRDGGSFIGAAPFFRAGERLHAFATAAYRPGFKLSTPVVEVDASALPGASPTLRPQALIDDMTDSGDWYWVPAYPDPKLEGVYFGPWTGPEGERGFTVVPFESENPPFLEKEGTLRFCMGTHKIGDPQWRGGAGDKALRIDCYGPRRPRELKVRVVTGFSRSDQKEYATQAEIDPAAEGWVTLTLEASRFKDRDGAPLPGWETVDFLELSGVSEVARPPVFRNLRWAERSPGR